MADGQVANFDGSTMNQIDSVIDTYLKSNQMPSDVEIPK